MSEWIVVADASGARIFENKDRKAELQEVADLPHPSGRAKASNMVTAARGRSASGTHNSSMAPHTGIHDADNLHFVRTVANMLEDCRTKNAFSSLRLIAPPRILGLLRGQLSDGCTRLVAKEIPHEIKEPNPRTVREYLSREAPQ